MSRHTRLAPFIVAGFVLLGASSVSASESGRGNAGVGNVDGRVELRADVSYLPSGSEGSKDPACVESSVQVVVGDDFVTPVTTDYYLTDVFDGATITEFRFNAARGRARGERMFSPTGVWYRGYCDGVVSLVPAGGPAVSVPGLVDQLVRSLDPPDPTLAVTPDHGRHVVRMKSWLAVEPESWVEHYDDIEIGRVEVWARLVPVGLEWDLGNGEEPLTCDNPGVVWRSGLDEDQSTCDYTYTWPSIDTDDQTYELTGLLRWEVEYGTNVPGTYGPFIPIERTTTETIEVIELQVVNR